MAEKHRLRVNRANTVINTTSKKQEKELDVALKSGVTQSVCTFTQLEKINSMCGTRIGSQLIFELGMMIQLT